MIRRALSGRALKREVLRLIQFNDMDETLEGLKAFPPRRVISPLMSYIQSSDPDVKWQAVKAMGAVTSKLADEDPESARVVMRRLMWNLNDESGGIGWGSPEAMGEILASHEDLAGEYHRILLSYAMEDGNFQESVLMQRGVIWGIGRLAQIRPGLVKDTAPCFTIFLKSHDAAVRGLTAHLLGRIGAEGTRSELEALTDDEEELQIYRDRKLVRCRVKSLAKEALASLKV